MLAIRQDKPTIVEYHPILLARKFPGTKSAANVFLTDRNIPWNKPLGKHSLRAIYNRTLNNNVF